MFPFSELAPVNELHTFYFTRLLFSLLLFFISIIVFIIMANLHFNTYLLTYQKMCPLRPPTSVHNKQTVVSFVIRAKEDHANCEEPAELQEGLQRGGIPEGTQEPRLVLKRCHAHFHVCVT